MEWRDKEPTEAQRKAHINMSFALTGRAPKKYPTTRGEASDEISRLRVIIQNNLTIGGSINPRRSVYANSGDWGVDHNGN